MRLLNSSTVVAISGGFRLHVAFLLAGIAIRITEYCAFALIVYATYTLDRALDCKEDAINKSDLTGADGRIGLIACMASFFAGAILLAIDGIYLAAFFPFIVGYIYTHGIRIGSYKLKLKAGVGIKNLIIGITWGGTMALIVGQWCGSILTVGMVFLIFGAKVFTTSCINDFKDVKGDLTAGIYTLPAYLGEKRTKIILVGVLLALYCIIFCTILLDIIRNEWVLLLYGLVIPILFLLVYSPSFEKSKAFIFRKMRDIVISGESPIALVIRACTMG